MGWGGACSRSCELAEVLDATLMMGWGGVGLGGVGWGMLTKLQNVAMEIHPHSQKLGESHGVQTARDVTKRCRQLRKPELV